MNKIVNKNMTLRCITALLLIAGLSVIGFGLSQQSIQNIRHSKQLLHLTSNQLANVQSIAYLTQSLAQTIPDSRHEHLIRERYSHTLTNFADDKTTLQNILDSQYSSGILQRSGYSNPAEYLSQLQLAIEEFYFAALRVYETRLPLTDDNQDKRFITDVALYGLDSNLSELVAITQQTSAQRLFLASWVNIAVLATTIALLVLVGLIIFRPMVQAVSTHHDQLLNANDFLESRARELATSKERLRRKTTILESILDTMADGVIVSDETGQIITQNRSAERLFGSVKSEATIEDWHAQAGLYSFETPEQAIDASNTPAALALQGMRFNDFTYFVNSHTGSKAYVSATGSPMIDKDSGKITGSVVNFRDISERVKQARALSVAKKQAEVANRSKSEFLANMSHEIRTPMSSILGYADCLADREQSDADKWRYINVIRRNARILLRIIDDLLDLSKIEAGKLNLAPTKVDFLELIADVYQSMISRADDKGLKLELVLGTKIPKVVHTDEIRLRQVLINLVGNAIKFTNAGHVVVTLKLISAKKYSDQNELLEISVKDTGCGIEPAQVEELFQMFSQADASLTRSYGGSGLGLAISRRLAKMLGGGLVLTSTELGKGSCFTLTLSPGNLTGVEMIDELKLEHMPHLQSRADPIRKEGLQGVSILLVEDSPENLELFSYFLESAGAKVSTAIDGHSALQQALNSSFDVILLDIQLPGIDGYEVIKRLREQGHSGVVLALTAHAFASDAKRCADHGFDGHIAKPIASSDLISYIDTYLDKSQQTKENQTGNPATTNLSKNKELTSLDFSVENLGPANSPAIRKIIARFIERLPQRIEALEKACENERYDSILSLAHQLKGTAASCGFPKLTRQAAVIEDQAKTNAPVDTVSREIRNLYQLQKRALRAFSGIE